MPQQEMLFLIKLDSVFLPEVVIDSQPLSYKCIWVCNCLLNYTCASSDTPPPSNTTHRHSVQTPAFVAQVHFNEALVLQTLDH